MQHLITAIVPLLQVVVAAPLTTQITALAIIAIVCLAVSLVSVVWILHGGADPD